MKTQHTPGPWTLYRTDRPIPKLIVRGDERELAIAEIDIDDAEGRVKRVSNDEAGLLTVYDCGCSAEVIAPNAPIVLLCPLHASAPDLLATLEAMTDHADPCGSRPQDTYYRNDMNSDEFTAWVRVARAAIARARGEAKGVRKAKGE